MDEQQKYDYIMNLTIEDAFKLWVANEYKLNLELMTYMHNLSTMGQHFKIPQLQFYFSNENTYKEMWRDRNK